MTEVTVTLREVTADTVRAVCALEVTPEQRSFVASNALSIAQAHFADNAWFRAVYADETPVGFVMLDEDTAEGAYFLWRFMIDVEHQGKGYGKRALDLVVEHVRALPSSRELLSSFVPGDAGPRGFYLHYGFVETGESDGGEQVIRLTL